MVAPMVRLLRANCHRDGHLRHHGRTAASDQAAVDQQHATAGARGFDRGIHAGAARPDDEDVGFGPHRLTAHLRPLCSSETPSTWEDIIGNQREYYHPNSWPLAVAPLPYRRGIGVA